MSEKGITVSLLLLLVVYCSCPAQAEEPAPQRIITLSPHLSEIVFLLGAEELLKGVAEHSDYPEQLKILPRIGGGAGLDMERIIAINPDLVLAWQGGTRETDIRSLKELGLRVVSIKSETLEDVPDSINILGELLNRQQRSAELILQFNKHKEKIFKKYSNQPEQRFYIEISSQPLMALTNHHSFGSGLGLCKLKNIFANESAAAIIIDLEAIISRHVEYILLRNSVADNAQELAARKSFYQINDGNMAEIISFDEDAAFRQTPRLLDAIEQVCQNVHGS